MTASGVFTSCATPAASSPKEVSFSVWHHLLFHAFALRDVVEENQAANALTGFADQRRDRNIQDDQTTLAFAGGACKCW